MKHYNTFFVPFEIRGPVYLEELKSNINGQSVGGDTFQVNRFSWKHLFFTRTQKNERRVIHIHWETNIYGSKYLIVSIIKGLLKFPALWFLKKFKGVKIVWTMHNLESHDYPHPKSDALGRRIMWQLADKIILHEKSYADEQKRKRKNIEIECIPPGNYINAYGPLWEGDRNALRQKYSLSQNSLVLLALGSVRPYKSLEPAIEAVLEATKKNIPIEFIIAGRAPKDYEEQIRKVAGSNKNIILNLNYIPDDNIAELNGLADYSLLYYGESALGSAAILLSLSYGVPVISRDFAVSELVIEGKNGFKFHDKAGLVKVLEKLPQVPKFDRQQVVNTVADWDWKKAGETTRMAYTSLYK